MSKYLVFVPQYTPKKKTKTFSVCNKLTTEKIGEIKWATNFRKYAFFSENGTYYDSACERELADFQERLMREKENRL